MINQPHPPPGYRPLKLNVNIALSLITAANHVARLAPIVDNKFSSCNITKMSPEKMPLYSIGPSTVNTTPTCKYSAQTNST